MSTDLSCECRCHRRPSKPCNCCTAGRTRGDGLPGVLSRRRDSWQEAVAQAEAEREAVRRALT